MEAYWDISPLFPGGRKPKIPDCFKILAYCWFKVAHG